MAIQGFRKKGTKKPEKYGIIFDSLDEIFMYDWCLDAKKAGLIQKFTYHPDSVLVFPDYIDKKKTILRKCTYTPDFILEGLDKRLKPYFRESFDKKIWIDVKGSFIVRGESKFFVLMTKVLWHLHKIFINKTVVQELCKKTFVPQSIKFTEKTKQLRAAFKDCCSLDEFLRKKV